MCKHICMYIIFKKFSAYVSHISLNVCIKHENSTSVFDTTNNFKDIGIISFMSISNNKYFVYFV